jgi:hypothetical protein
MWRMRGSHMLTHIHSCLAIVSCHSFLSSSGIYDITPTSWKVNSGAWTSTRKYTLFYFPTPYMFTPFQKSGLWSGKSKSCSETKTTWTLLQLWTFKLHYHVLSITQLGLNSTFHHQISALWIFLDKQTELEKWIPRLMLSNNYPPVAPTKCPFLQLCPCKLTVNQNGPTNPLFR